MPIIDGEEFRESNVLTPSKGSGDSEEKFTISVLRNGGRTRWLLQDKGKWWLYASPPEPVAPYTVAKTYEEFKADRVGGQGGSRDFRWVQLEQPYMQAEPPFQGATEALVISSGGPASMMLSLPLMVGKPGVYYTPSFPASKVPRDPVAVKEGLGGGRLVPHLSLIMAAIFGAAVLVHTPAPIGLLWWLGPVAIACRYFTTRQSSWDHVFRLLAGVFFLHFVTHGFDNRMTEEMEDQMVPMFESAKVFVLCLGLWVLRLWKPRYYFSVIDGVNLTGGCSWLLFACVMGFVSMDEEFNYFSFFNYYAGVMPWSILWFCAALFGFMYTLSDYRKVPLDLKGFRSLLYRSADTLDQKLDVCVHKSEALVQWADDLEDALSISADPVVASLLDYGPFFTAWRDQAKNLKDVDPKTLDSQTREQLEADLATVASDFRDIVACIDGWPQAQSKLQSLRRSPLLETWNQ